VQGVEISRSAVELCQPVFAPFHLKAEHVCDSDVNAKLLIGLASATPLVLWLRLVRRNGEGFVPSGRLVPRTVAPVTKEDSDA